MAGVGIRIDATAARASLKRMVERAANPKPLLRRIGAYGVKSAKKRIRQGIPPPKHPYFAELQRRTGGMGGNRPLYVTGELYRSVFYAISGRASVRAGSPLRKAATHQFSSDGPRSFYLYIIPDTVPGAHGKTRYERNAYGFVLGKLTTRADFTSGQAVKQLITVQVRERPFLKAPSDAEWDEIADIIQEHLEGQAA